MMTKISATKPGQGKSIGKTLIQMVVGAIVGFVGIMLVDKLVGVKWMAENISTPGLFAILLATIFILIGAIVFVMSFSKKMLTYNRDNADMDAEEFADMKPILRWSAVTMLLCGGTFILLAFANPAAGAPQTGYFWAVVGSIIAQAAITVYLWRQYDELWRDITKQACAISFALCETLLFIWAAATIFGLDISFDPLAVLVVTTAISTLASVGLTIQKGLTK